MDKMVYLVTFTKWKKEKTTDPDSIIDIQYHCFEGCSSVIDVIEDSIYQAFIYKGYSWSAILFPLDMAYKCGFTISKIGE